MEYIWVVGLCTHAFFSVTFIAHLTTTLFWSFDPFSPLSALISLNMEFQQIGKILRQMSSFIISSLILQIGYSMYTAWFPRNITTCYKTVLF